MTETAHHRPTLVLGGTGKTGRRLVEDFANYPRATAATGVWNPTAQPNPGGPR
jgi:hypothetical protein